MFSGVLAGFLKVAAVGLVAGGFATGLYFTIQVSEREDGGARLQVEATQTAGLASPTLPPPPGDLSPPLAPTATFPPAPITPPSLDTSDWRTYTSPLGFSIKYPPTWAVEVRDVSDLPQGRAKILNERAQAGQLAASGGEGGAGEAWIEIAPEAFPRFDVNELYLVCGVEDESIRQSGLSVEATQVTLAGLPTVRCLQEGPTHYNPAHRVTVEIYWIALPSGRVAHIAAYAVDSNPEISGLLEAALSTVSFVTTS